MVCSNCKVGRLKRQRGLYHYTESGLPDVFLKNVRWTLCEKCGAREVELPKLGQLHRCIAWSIVTKNMFLTGPEMIFLRRMLRKSQGEMASLLGVTQVALNRWEREKRKTHGKANDSLIRLLYLSLQNDEYTHEVNQQVRKTLAEYFSRIKAAPSKQQIQIDATHFSAREVVRSTVEHLSSGIELGQPSA